MRMLWAFVFTYCAWAGAPKVEPHIKAAVEAFRAGHAAVGAQDWQRAEKSYLRAIDIEPTFVEAYRALEELYSRTSRPMDLGAVLARLLQIEPDALPERLRLARLLIENNEWNRALAQLSLAMKIDPHDAETLYWFGFAAIRADMADRASEVLARGAAEFPEDRRFGELLRQIKPAAAPGSRP